MDDLNRDVLNRDVLNQMHEMTGANHTPLTDDFYGGAELTSKSADAATTRDAIDPLGGSVLTRKKPLERNCLIPLDASPQKRKAFSRLLYKPVLRRLRKLIAKIRGRKHAEVLRVIHLCQGGNHFFHDGWIDNPKANDRLYGSAVAISGWMLGKQVQPIAVRLTSGQATLAEAPLNVARPDVFKAYFAKSAALQGTVNFGYRMVLAIESLPDELDLQLEAIFPNGEALPAGLIRFSKYGY